ncbi:agamous-like MADS-box protein AGL61 [Phragmites australis]|uniref:agamous-like MADS-box protein AGL61 n=1 Tax=Phragmites australis TaxID=29695 RepID=UPI002D78418E|nr:agamous-like MADS-box protein AGL61 [Phragmites australis]XP_062228914.1 agamous-like MADS-box protein AGL61 [Phragmites australis]
MVKELRRFDNEAQRKRSFNRRISTVLVMARDLSEEFGPHVVVVAFSPAGEPHAFGGPTADSVLRTYLPIATPAAAASFPSGAETVWEAAARVVGMRQEMEETNVLVASESKGLVAAAGKIRAAQASARKRNWWEVDVEALGEEELPVFVRALELLRADVQGRLDAMASARQPLPWKENQQQ